MSRTSNIILAAIGGAAVGAVLANYLMSERGRELLHSATNTLKDIGGQATEYAKNNLGEIIHETKSSLGDIVKEKIAQQVGKQPNM
jgi:hypothetical protein